MKKTIHHSLDEISSVLVIGFVGIGNLLLFSPVIRRLKREKPSLMITLITLSENGSLDFFIREGIVDQVHFLSHVSRRQHCKKNTIVCYATKAFIQNPS